MISEQDDYFDANDALGYDDEFQIAAALVAFDNSTDIDDESYGKLRFYAKQWSGTSSKLELQLIEIEQKYCGIEAFEGIDDLEGANARFYKP